MATKATKNLPDKPTKKLPRGHSRKIDVHKAFDLRLRGLTYEEIAKQFGCCKQSVQEALAPFQVPDGGTVDLFKDRRADILAATQVRLLQGLTDEKIKQAKLGELSIAFGTLFDKERLERGQSTQNQGVMVVFQAMGKAATSQLVDEDKAQPTA
jgi:hypothetical protein